MADIDKGLPNIKRPEDEIIEEQATQSPKIPGGG